MRRFQHLALALCASTVLAGCATPSTTRLPPEVTVQPYERQGDEVDLMARAESLKAVGQKEGATRIYRDLAERGYPEALDLFVEWQHTYSNRALHRPLATCQQSPHVSQVWNTNWAVKALARQGDERAILAYDACVNNMPPEFDNADSREALGLTEYLLAQGNHDAGERLLQRYAEPITHENIFLPSGDIRGHDYQHRPKREPDLANAERVLRRMSQIARATQDLQTTSVARSHISAPLGIASWRWEEHDMNGALHWLNIAIANAEETIDWAHPGQKNSMFNAPDQRRQQRVERHAQLVHHRDTLIGHMRNLGLTIPGETGDAS